MEDRWVWNLENSGEFSVASIRRKIDDSRFPTIGDKTRWVKFVPIKINVFAWKVTVNALPTRYNLSRRGMDIQSLSCLMCDCGIESTDHVFVGCDVSRQLGCMISNWWNTPLVEMDTIAAWKTWFSSIRLARNLKSIVEVCKTRTFALEDKPHYFFAPEGKPPRRGLNPRPLACGNNLPKKNTIRKDVVDFG
nr:RNA-directed DNA polymerase, eukaryota [Tanacetum cinerariifolium]